MCARFVLCTALPRGIEWIYIVYARQSGCDFARAFIYWGLGLYYQVKHEAATELRLKRSTVGRAVARVRVWGHGTSSDHKCVRGCVR